MNRQNAHRLLDQLDPVQLAAVGQLLTVMVNPVARALAAAQPDDEPFTEQDLRRVQEGQIWFEKRGDKGISMDDVLTQNSFLSDDFR